jgi:cation diffusion facilitator family transporter
MSAHSKSETKLNILKFSAIAIASVVIVEVVLGLIVDSLAIQSDGLHALLDVFSTVMLFAATRASLKPPDEEHTYGHEKYEAIGGLIGGLILIGIALLIFYEAAVRFVSNIQVNEKLKLAGFIAIGYTLCIDLFRVAIFRRAGPSQGTSFKAGFYDAISDLGSTLIALLGFGLAITGFYYGDSIASIFLGSMLIFLSINLTRASITELSDTASKEIIHKTRKAVFDHDGILDCQNLKVRKVGSKIFAECTVQVSNLMSLEEAHALASDIEGDLSRTFGNVDATIHIEPAEVTKLEPLVEMLSSVENVKEVHDIVTVYSGGKIYVTLHVYADPKLSVEDAHEIAEKIESIIHTKVKQLGNVTVHVEPYSVGKHIAEIDENELRSLIEKLAKKVKNSLRTKRIVTYKADGKSYINVDCCLTKHIPLSVAHDIVSHFEKEIAEYFVDAAVTVHIEPECEKKVEGKKGV